MLLQNLSNHKEVLKHGQINCTRGGEGGWKKNRDEAENWTRACWDKPCQWAQSLWNPDQNTMTEFPLQHLKYKEIDSLVRKHHLPGLSWTCQPMWAAQYCVTHSNGPSPVSSWDESMDGVFASSLVSLSCFIVSIVSSLSGCSVSSSSTTGSASAVYKGSNRSAQVTRGRSV